MSLEALNPRDSVAARSRYAMDLRAATAGVLSDLLLLSGADTLPTGLDAALPLIQPGNAFDAGEEVVVYWEWHTRLAGIHRVALAVRRVGKGFLRAAAEWLGLADERPSDVILRWEEPAPVRRARAVAVRLPQQAGRYLLRLTVRLPDGQEEIRERQLVVGGDTRRQ